MTVESHKLSSEDQAKIIEMLAAREPYQLIADTVRCSIPNIDYYARRYADKIAKEQAKWDARYINRGLRTWHKRVERLELLAQRLEYELSEEAGRDRGTDNGGLWVKDVKLSGKQRADVEVFAASIVQQYRGVLEDIAKEMGERVEKIDDVSSDKGLTIKVVRVASNRSGDQGTPSGSVED